MDWVAQVHTRTPTQLTTTAQEDIAHTLRATLTYNSETRDLTALFELAANTATEAVESALHLATALPAPPTRISIQTAEQFLHDTAHPAPQDLVGAVEAGELLGISRQRVVQLTREHQQFPAPVARLRAGPVWTRASIQAFQERAGERRPGRPRRHPDPAHNESYA